MTEIEQKALALVNEVRAEWGGNWAPRTKPFSHEAFKALCRAIEQHEAFRQEVSDALEKRGFYIDDRDLGRFIIPQPDPLHECLEEALARTGEDLTEHTERLHAALAARGLELVKKEPNQ